jgi:hypothetical protein
MDPGLFSREDLTQGVHDNLRNLGVDMLDIVNLRAMFDVHHPVGLGRAPRYEKCLAHTTVSGAACASIASMNPSSPRRRLGSPAAA